MKVNIYFVIQYQTEARKSHLTERLHRILILIQLNPTYFRCMYIVLADDRQRETHRHEFLSCF